MYCFHHSLFLINNLHEYLQNHTNYCILVITSDAETLWVPPAIGVIVRAGELPGGLITLKIEYGTEVTINTSPTI